MPALLVTYDLNLETKRPKITDAIKELANGWARLSESSYAISTHMTSTDVYNQLAKHIDNNDQIYIIPLKKPWMGFGPVAINKWLDDNLTY